MPLLVLLLLSFAVPARAQISPPGLGEAETAAWFAAGVRQDVDARRSLVGYLGMGRISGEHDNDALRRPAIFVVNQEFSDRFRRNLRYSLALSYRRQNLYPESSDEHEQPGFKRELRLYGRFAHVFERGRVELNETVRPELRSFFTPSRHAYDEALELRLRLRGQLAVDLDARGTQRVLGSAEVLGATTKGRGAWTDFGYRESRFCLYYSFHEADSPLVFDIGYMNDLIGYGSGRSDVHYLAFDVTWQNPFGTHARAGG